MIEQQQNQIQISPAVQQALNKLNIRITDLMEQTNTVIKILLEENTELQTKLENQQKQQQLPKETPTKQ